MAYLVIGHGDEMHDEFGGFSIKKTTTLQPEVSQLNFLVPSGTCARYSFPEVMDNLSTNVDFYRYEVRNAQHPTYTDVEISWDNDISAGGVYLLGANGLMPVFTLDDMPGQTKPLSELIADTIDWHNTSGIQNHLGAFPIRVICLTCRAGRQVFGDSLTHQNKLTRVVRPTPYGGTRKRIRRISSRRLTNRIHKKKTKKKRRSARKL